MLTIYDAEIERLNRQLEDAKRRFNEFVAPLRKRRNSLRVMKARALTGEDVTKYAHFGEPADSHLLHGVIHDQVRNRPPVATDAPRTAQPIDQLNDPDIDDELGAPPE